MAKVRLPQTSVEEHFMVLTFALGVAALQAAIPEVLLLPSV